MIYDNPLFDATDDRLGFGTIAVHLATAFLQNDLKQGFVVGVEGAWGSGKSSLVNLALDELRRSEDGPKVIEFAPWLVGSRNELLGQLFSDLEPVILDAIPASEREDTKNILSRYAHVSSGLATLADFAEIGGVPWAGFAKRLLNTTGNKAAQLSKSSLSDLNKSLRSKLELLDQPIIVFIDDLDRLEPSEIAEVLRLVKAVADFPNVAYILAYDPEVIAKSIESALGISNGDSYLEKVVQASFKVPDAMNYDLRNWLKEEMSHLLDGVALEAEVRNRLDGVYHIWCTEFLETPRDVVRVVNSLKLNFMPVRDQVDPGDMVFLQIIKTKNSKLYRWIENYVSSLSAIGDWGIISRGAHERVGKQLLELTNKHGEDQIQFIYALAEHLPGFDLSKLHSKTKEFRVFSLDNVDELTTHSTEKRLASPNHYSFYFSFSRPSGNLDDEEVEQFLISCKESPKNAILNFHRMVASERPQGGRLAELLLDRIVEFGTRVPPGQVQGLFHILGESIDELIPFAKTEYGYPQFLKGNRRQVFGLIDQIEGEKAREETLRALFTEASSIAWLAGIIRETTFELDKSGELNSAWLISTNEFDLIKQIFISRLTEVAPSNLLQTPFFLNLMYAWLQLGDFDGSLNWIKGQTESDRGFLEVLEKMTSWRESSSEGVSYRLARETLDTFFDGESYVRNRLDKISNDKSVDETTRRKTQDVLKSIKA